MSYNSENWRQDPGGTWQFGHDLGYGYGWKLQAGSILPVYSDWLTVHHYLFTDASGQPLRLTPGRTWVEFNTSLAVFGGVDIVPGAPTPTTLPATTTTTKKKK